MFALQPPQNSFLLFLSFARVGDDDDFSTKIIEPL